MQTSYFFRIGKILKKYVCVSLEVPDTLLLLSIRFLYTQYLYIGYVKKRYDF